MADTTATIRLRAVDTNVSTTLGNLSTNFTYLTVASTAASFALKGIEKASNTSAAAYVLGAKNADRLSTSIAGLTDTNNLLLKSFGKLSDVTFIAQQGATAIEGLYRAYQAFSKTPTALQSIEAIGINTAPVAQALEIKEAFLGSEAAAENFVVSTIGYLAQFEAAAARAGTILRSSLRFDEAGNALRASSQEQLENALSVQKLVNEELGNTVSSVDALTGQYEVLSSGFTDAAKSQQVLASGLKLIAIGSAGGASADPTATLQLLTKTLNAYEFSAEKAGKTSAILNAIVENGLTTIPELSLGFGATAKQAALAGIALEDLASAVAVLTVQGVSTPEALTGISRIASNIVNKTPETEKALAKLSLGGQKIRFDKAEIEAKGFTQAIIDLQNAAGGSAEVLSQVFPEDVAFRTVTALLAESGNRLKNTTTSIAGATEESLNEVFEIASNDRISRAEKIVNRFKESLISIAIDIAPVLEPGLKSLEGLANYLNNMPDWVKKGIAAWIQSKIATDAATSAFKILIGTIATLATNYLMVRAASLLLSGQMGNEIDKIKQLILQKRGLLAVTAQIFGFDQQVHKLGSDRLKSIEAETKAQQVLNKIKQTASSVTQKGVAVAKEAAAGTIGFVAGTDKETVKSNVRGNVAKAQNYVSELVARVDWDRDKSLRENLSSVRNVAASVVNEVLDSPTAPDRYSKYIKAGAGEPLFESSERTRRIEAVPAVPLGTFSFVRDIRANDLSPVPRLSSAGLAGDRGSASAPSNLSDKLLAELTNKDIEVVRVEKERQKVQEKYDRLTQQVKVKTEAIEKTDLNIAEKRLSLQEKIAAAAKLEGDDRVKAQSEILKAQQEIIDLDDYRNKQLIEIEKQQKPIAESREELDRLNVQAQTIRTKASDRLKETADAIVKADELKAIAAEKKLEEDIVRNDLEIAKRNAANKDRFKGELDEAKSTGDKDKITAAERNYQSALDAQKNVILNNAALRSKHKAATAAATAATQAQSVAENLYRKNVEASILAEQGLIKTRLFGRDLAVSNVGAIGKLNTVLAAEVTWTNLATAAKVKYNAISALIGSGSGKLTAQLSKIGQVKVWDAIGSGAQLAEKGVKALGAGVKGVTTVVAGASASFAGLAGLLALPIGFGVIALREELFGVGKQIDDISDRYVKLIKEEEGMKARFAKQSAGKELIKSLDEGKDLRVEIDRLGNTQIINEVERDRLLSSLAATEKGAGDAKAAIANLRSEINQLGKTEMKIEGSVFDVDWSGIGKGIMGGFDAVTNAGATAFQYVINPTNWLEKNPIELYSDTVASREADRFLKASNTMIKISQDAYDRVAILREQTFAIEKYGAIDKELQGLIQKGELFTTSNLAEIAGKRTAAETTIKGLEDKLNKVGAKERGVIEGQIAAQKTGLELIKIEESAAKDKDKAAAAAIEREKTNVNEQKQLIETRIATQKQIISETEAQLGNAKSDETKTRLFAQIGEAKNNVNLLQKELEDFDKASSAALEYYTKQYPELIRSLTNNNDLKAALASTKKDFEQQFILDANLNPTAFYKDIETLRNEAYKYAEQIGQSLQFGLFDEGKAANQLRGIRDSQIEFLKDGVTQTAFRLSSSDRQSMTEQILGLEETARARIEKQNEFEIAKIKARASYELDTETENAIAINQINQRTIALKIEGKEREIAELRKVGLKTTEREQQLQELQLNLEDSVSQRRLLNFQARMRARRQLLEEESLIATANINLLDRQSQNIQQSQKLPEALRSTESTALDLLEGRLSRELELTRDVQLRGEAIVKIEKFKADRLEKNVEIEAQNLGIQQQLAELAARRSVLEQTTALTKVTAAKEELQATIRRSIVEGVSDDKLDELYLRLDAAQLEEETARSSLGIAKETLALLPQIQEQERIQLGLRQQNSIEAARANIELKEQEKTISKISKEQENAALQAKKYQQELNKTNQTLEGQNKLIDAQKQLVSNRLEDLKTSEDLALGQLDIVTSLTDNEYKKEDLAKSVATIKLESLQQQLDLEAKVLAFNQEQEKTQLAIEAVRNRVSSAQNEADIAEAKANIAKLQATKGTTPEELAAAKLNLEAKYSEREALQLENKLLGDRASLLEGQQQLARTRFTQQSQLKLDRAQVEALQYLYPEKDLGDISGLPEATQQLIRDSSRYGLAGNTLREQLRNQSLDRVRGLGYDPDNFQNLPDLIRYDKPLNYGRLADFLPQEVPRPYQITIPNTNLQLPIGNRGSENKVENREIKVDKIAVNIYAETKDVGRELEKQIYGILDNLTDNF